MTEEALGRVVQRKTQFAQLPFWMLPVLTDSEAIVYAGLCRFENLPDGNRPAVRGIAGVIGRSESYVERALKGLRGKGIVTVEARWRGKQRLPSYYHLVFDQRDATPGFAADATPGFAADATPGFAADATLASLATEELDTTATQKEPDARELPRARRESSAEADFEVFWKAYPRRTGKGAALKAYVRALKKVEASAILAAVTASSWPKDLRYVPHPTTWLNQERWSDEDPSTASADPRSREERRRAQGAVSW